MSQEMSHSILCAKQTPEQYDIMCYTMILKEVGNWEEGERESLAMKPISIVEGITGSSLRTPY